MSFPDVPRKGKGQSGAGRFDFKRNSEAEIDLSDDLATDSVVSPYGEVPVNASPDEIRALAESPDHFIRAELPGLPNVPEDVLETLQQPDQEFATRQSVLATMYPGVAERASHDRHPLIRAHALFAGWDLHDADRLRLEKDGGVKHVMELLSR